MNKGFNKESRQSLNGRAFDKLTSFPLQNSVVVSSTTSKTSMHDRAIITPVLLKLDKNETNPYYDTQCRVESLDKHQKKKMLADVIRLCGQVKQLRKRISAVNVSNSWSENIQILKRALDKTLIDSESYFFSVSDDRNLSHSAMWLDSKFGALLVCDTRTVSDIWGSNGYFGKCLKFSIEQAIVHGEITWTGGNKTQFNWETRFRIAGVPVKNRQGCVIGCICTKFDIASFLSEQQMIYERMIRQVAAMASLCYQRHVEVASQQTHLDASQFDSLTANCVGLQAANQLSGLRMHHFLPLFYSTLVKYSPCISTSVVVFLEDYQVYYYPINSSNEEEFIDMERVEIDSKLLQECVQNPGIFDSSSSICNLLYTMISKRIPGKSTKIVTMPLLKDRKPFAVLVCGVEQMSGYEEIVLNKICEKTADYVYDVHHTNKIHSESICAIKQLQKTQKYLEDEKDFLQNLRNEFHCDEFVGIKNAHQRNLHHKMSTIISKLLPKGNLFLKRQVHSVVKYSDLFHNGDKSDELFVDEHGEEMNVDEDELIQRHINDKEGKTIGILVCEKNTFFQGRIDISAKYLGRIVENICIFRQVAEIGSDSRKFNERSLQDFASYLVKLPDRMPVHIFPSMLFPLMNLSRQLLQADGLGIFTFDRTASIEESNEEYTAKQLLFTGCQELNPEFNQTVQLVQQTGRMHCFIHSQQTSETKHYSDTSTNSDSEDLPDFLVHCLCAPIDHTLSRIKPSVATNHRLSVLNMKHQHREFWSSNSGIVMQFLRRLHPRSSKDLEGRFRNTAGLIPAKHILTWNRTGHDSRFTTQEMNYSNVISGVCAITMDIQFRKALLQEKWHNGTLIQNCFRAYITPHIPMDLLQLIGNTFAKVLGCDRLIIHRVVAEANVIAPVFESNRVLEYGDSQLSNRPILPMNGTHRSAICARKNVPVFYSSGLDPKLMSQVEIDDAGNEYVIWCQLCFPIYDHIREKVIGVVQADNKYPRVLDMEGCMQHSANELPLEAFTPACLAQVVDSGLVWMAQQNLKHVNFKDANPKAAAFLESQSNEVFEFVSRHMMISRAKEAFLSSGEKAVKLNLTNEYGKYEKITEEVSSRDQLDDKIDIQEPSEKGSDTSLHKCRDEMQVFRKRRFKFAVMRLLDHEKSRQQRELFSNELKAKENREWTGLISDSPVTESSRARRPDNAKKRTSLLTSKRISRSQIEETNVVPIAWDAMLSADQFKAVVPKSKRGSMKASVMSFRALLAAKKD